MATLAGSSAFILAACGGKKTDEGAEGTEGGSDLDE